ncbi:hypothetical protein C6P46_001844 [Rhodotorula mucilaginosa]|uniref:Uncharacterized protein n=1 Tax=Rhodotorula mucilaginosa TaxID=5537 RepID=A0A9P7B230_RHOMI|nr:hypothetical protein C6P46_001844 [Rhodotorula mucilaginosa]
MSDPESADRALARRSPQGFAPTVQHLECHSEPLASEQRSGFLLSRYYRPRAASHLERIKSSEFKGSWEKLSCCTLGKTGGHATIYKGIKLQVDKLREATTEARVRSFLPVRADEPGGGDRTGSHQKDDGFRRGREGLTDDRDDRYDRDEL